ncbi:MAG: hypothetical protein FJZ01_08900 [Candidatus Sericytochromatia bacterium]|nr:hypothetical protein [Candidatus Tanganyikabacteria bacterium]
MFAALILAVGVLLAAGVVLAGAPLLSERLGLHPIAAARAALACGLGTALAFSAVAGFWLRG